MERPETTQRPIQQSPRRTSLVVSAMSNWSALVVNIVLGFILTPLLILHLGQGGYGIWSLVASILGCYGLLDLGVSSALGRYVAWYDARGETHELNETVSTALLFFIIVGLGVAGGVALGAVAIGHLFLDEADRVREFAWVLRLLGLATAINLLGQVFRSVLLGLERFVHRNVIAVMSQIVRAAMVVGVLLQGWGLVGVAAVTLLSDAVATVAYVWVVRRTCPTLHVSRGRLRWRSLRPLLAFGLTSSVIVAADVIRVNIDSMVIAWLISVEAVAIYHVAVLLVRYTTRFVFHGMGVLTPRLAGLDGQARHRELRGLVIRSMWVSAFLTAGGCLLLVVLGKAFIQLWVGAGFDAAYPVLAVFAGGMYLELAQLPAVNALYAMNRHRYLAVTRSIEAVANLVLSIIMVRYLGIVGVAVGTLIPLLIVNTLVQPTYMVKLLGVRRWTFYQPMIVCLLPACAMLGLWELRIERQLAPTRWAELLLAAAVVGGGYVLLVAGMHLCGWLPTRPVAVWRRLAARGAPPAEPLPPQ